MDIQAGNKVEVISTDDRKEYTIGEILTVEYIDRAVDDMPIFDIVHCVGKGFGMFRKRFKIVEEQPNAFFIIGIASGSIHKLEQDNIGDVLKYVARTYSDNWKEIFSLYGGQQIII